ncbi:hypothetical protein [Subtercola frigoramans]|uniref:AbiEi antitoxin C-terminal domain-containing protein n=1 Tax=Subtercola frigoramans TaxID=120298 RepID=A0ABS2L4X6_9MICO|nr:hypothetical protein [Subtercola frigoramans]MBM7472155.1 hypothetical protein [Subtercola frigoramans]
MPTSLPRILASASRLNPHDFDIAELHAMRLDGETIAIDDAFTSVDEPHTLALRLGVLSSLMPARAIVECNSALWVYGALPRPPAVHSFCIPVGGNSRPVAQPRLRVREVALRSGDVVEVDGVSLTSPVRTAIDLVRLNAVFGASEAETLARLFSECSVTVEKCVERLDRSPGIPHRIRALARLNRTLEGWCA